MDGAEFIGRVCSLQGMDKDQSKIRLGIDYGKITLNSRHSDMNSHFRSCFKEVMVVFVVKEAPKTHILMLHVLRMIMPAYKDLPPGFNRETRGGSYGALYQRYRTSRCTISYGMLVLHFLEGGH